MKKMMFLATMAAVMMTACTQDAADEVTNQEYGKKTMTFSCQGDFTMTGTRGAMDADGKTMTDLWVLDYMGGALVQQLHKVSTDDDFSTPSLTLDYGTHHIYFVASRGTTPTLSTDAHKISWVKPSDTFYKDLTITVSSGTSSTQAVALDRVATKLSITIQDELPNGIASIDITPATWYYGMDYQTGLPTDAQTAQQRNVNIPMSYIGRTNTNLSIYGISATTEWTTNVSITALDGDSEVLGQATITSAPFKANRVTAFSGNLFISDDGFDMSLNSTWDDDYKGTW